MDREHSFRCACSIRPVVGALCLLGSVCANAVALDCWFEDSLGCSSMYGVDFNRYCIEFDPPSAVKCDDDITSGPDVLVTDYPRLAAPGETGVRDPDREDPEYHDYGFISVDFYKCEDGECVFEYSISLPCPGEQILAAVGCAGYEDDPGGSE